MTAKELKSLLLKHQEQTNGNFHDLNDDFDDVRGYLVKLIEMMEAVLKILQPKEGETNEP